MHINLRKCLHMCMYPCMQEADARRLRKGGKTAEAIAREECVCVCAHMHVWVCVHLCSSGCLGECVFLSLICGTLGTKTYIAVKLIYWARPRTRVAQKRFFLNGITRNTMSGKISKSQTCIFHLKLNHSHLWQKS